MGGMLISMSGTFLSRVTSVDARVGFVPVPVPSWFPQRQAAVTVLVRLVHEATVAVTTN